MVFITVGSQKFQFNRLLKEIDNMVENEIITEPVFAQIGASDYIPKNYEYVDFMHQEDFSKMIDSADIIITHAGTGIIVNAIKKEKKVVAIPRLAKYGEHVDNHQIQLIDEFAQLNFIQPVYEIKELGDALKKIKEKKFNKYVSNIDNIVESIERFIGNEDEGI